MYCRVDLQRTKNHRVELDKEPLSSLILGVGRKLNMCGQCFASEIQSYDSSLHVTVCDTFGRCGSFGAYKR